MPQQTSKPTHNKNLTVLAAIIGSTLEWYDFLLYAYFTPILAPLFFPAHDPFVSLVMTYSVFAIGFLIRPLGALIIGRWGDIYGRRNVLIFCIACMTIPTVAIGLLPGYASIGLVAPVLLTILRCLQGFAVSGEINSATAFLIEHAQPDRRGFAGSLIMSATFLGILMGAVIVTLLTAIIPATILNAWGWRIPFLLSGVFGIFGLILRIRVSESPSFVNIKRQAKTTHTPIKLLFQHYKLRILRGICITTVIAIGNYFLLAYFNTYLVETAKFTLNQAMFINCVAIAVFLVMVSLAGMLSDRLGRKRLFILGCLLLCVVTIPAFWLLAHNAFLYALAGEVLFATVLGITDGLILTLLAEVFPTNVRNSGASITYNTSLAIFGGTAPLIAISLVHASHIALAPAFYLIAGTLLSLACMIATPETHNQPLQ